MVELVSIFILDVFRAVTGVRDMVDAVLWGRRGEGAYRVEKTSNARSKCQSMAGGDE